MVDEKLIKFGKQSFNPSTIFPPLADYSHGVLAQPGPIVVTSGQVGIRADGSIPKTVEEQAEICFENINTILSQAGMVKSDIIRLNAFVIDRVYLTGYINWRESYLADLVVKPASSVKIVAGFARPECLVEVEALAVASQVDRRNF